MQEDCTIITDAGAGAAFRSLSMDIIARRAYCCGTPSPPCGPVRTGTYKEKHPAWTPNFVSELTIRKEFVFYDIKIRTNGNWKTLEMVLLSGARNSIPGASEKS